jgi:LPS-assembly protein
LINRLYRKDKLGNTNEIFTWEVAQARFFDPTFGGAVLSGTTPGVPGYRNVVYWSADLTSVPFLDGPRTYSPIVSSMQVNPYSFFGIDWRTDYDPLRHKFVDQIYSANFRYKNYSANVGQTSIATNPLLVPDANQIFISGSYGSSTRKGWNFTGTVMRDLLRSLDTLESVQAAYNTDCCGFSFRYQRINFGARQGENQYLFSFSVANIGTFGSLQRAQTRF